MTTRKVSIQFYVIAVLTGINIISCRVVTSYHPNIGQGGRVEAITASPVNDNHLIVASETGGMFKSINGGDNWSWIRTPIFVFSDVQYAPWNANLVVATGTDDWNKAGKGGVWVSSNGGNSFTKATQADECIGCTHDRTGFSVEMDVYRSQVYAGTDMGLYIGDEGGINWRLSNPKVVDNRAVYSVLTADRNSVIAMCDDGLYESTNGGDTWSKIYNKPDTVDFIGRHNNLVRSPFNANSLFMNVSYWRGIRQCLANDASRYFELWFSADRGRTWRIVRNRECWGSRTKFVKAAKVSSDSPNEFYVYTYTGTQIKRSRCTQLDNDVRFGDWQDYNMPHADIGDICFANDRATVKLVGGDGGLFKQNGTDWVYTGGGVGGYNALQLTEITGQKNTRSGGWTLYMATQDNDIKSSPDGGIRWTGNKCCEGFYLNVMPTTDGSSITRLTGVACAGCGNFKAEHNLSNQGGWPNPPNDVGNPYMLSYDNYLQNTRLPGIDSNIYMISRNFGGDWTNRFGFKEAIASMPKSTRESNPTAFVAADHLTATVSGNVAQRILKKITNVSGTGEPIVSSIENFGGLGTMATEFAWYRIFAIDPSNANHIIVTDLQDSAVKYTHDGGLTWTRDDALTNMVTDNGRIWFRRGEHCQVSAIAIDPSKPCHILVGTQQNGIFRTTNGGSSWTKLEESEWIPKVTSFLFQEDRVLASSYGRGLWALNYRFPRSCIALIDRSVEVYGEPVFREMITGSNVPFREVNNGVNCSICKYVITKKGNFKNLRIDEKFQLLGYEKDDGASIETYDVKNNKIDSNFLIQPNQNKQAQPNKVLQDIERRKESIKGLVLENGVLKGVILSGKDFEPSAYRKQFNNSPQLSLEDPSGKFYYTASGYLLKGRFWQPQKAIQLLIDGKAIEGLNSVIPDKDGSFSLVIKHWFDKGGHVLTAVQQNGDKKNEAVVSWNVARIEMEKN